MDSVRTGPRVDLSPSNLVIAPAIVVAIFFLLRAGQAAVAATLIGAWFALARSISQGAADFRRRINETYSRAVSQLASDKLEERLGGIYTLENISKESPDDYWTAMENLTAFVRERTQRTAADPEERRTQRIEVRAYGLWEKAGRPEWRSDEFWREAVEQEPPEADVAAVLTAIKRRVSFRTSASMLLTSSSSLFASSSRRATSARPPGLPWPSCQSAIQASRRVMSGIEATAEPFQEIEFHGNLHQRST